MNTNAANAVIQEMRKKSILSADDEFLYIEALEYMIEATDDTDYMTELGGYYYEMKIYDKALKYYEMADAHGDSWAAEGLGYIWYYGRTGTVDYQKAFRYYSKAAEHGNLKSLVKVADMYRNGYYVEKDMQKYTEILEDAKRKMEHPQNYGDPLPEIYTRLARIRKEEGNTDEAVSLYLDAKDFLARRIMYTGFFGDRNIMKWLIEDLYTLIPFDETEFDLYDLYYVLKQPCRVRFSYRYQPYIIESAFMNGRNVIHFNDAWYGSIDDFFEKASIHNKRLTAVYGQLYGFEIL